MIQTKMKNAYALRRRQMSNSIMKKKIIGSLAIGLIAIFSIVGLNAYEDKVVRVALEAQAEINHSVYDAFRKIQIELNNGCFSRASSRIEFLLAQQKLLMAEHIMSDNSTSFEQYLRKRDPELLTELMTIDLDSRIETVLPDC